MGAPDDLGTASEAVVVCAHGATVLGVDVSHYQGSINWSAVHASGRDFGIAGVGDGMYQDPTFATNWNGMRAAGMIRGAYQFFEPGEDPVAQANIMIARVGHLGAGDLPCTLDVEVTGGQSSATIAAHIRTWIDRVAAATGKTPMIYTGFYFWRDSVGSGAFAANPLWIAAYGPPCPNVPSPWTDWRFFQFTDAASVPGISGGTDGDRFNGSLAELMAFAGMSAPPQPDWAAQYVAQSFPLAASGHVTLHVGESTPAWIELRNVGRHAWDDHTHLATTAPRDRASPFVAPGWPAANRPAGVAGSVAPGATYRFAYTLRAPSMPGTYTEHYGMVEDTVAWFSDPGQGGPPDNQLEAVIDVLPAVSVPDAGHPPTDAGAPPTDTGPVADDAGTPATDIGVVSNDAGMSDDTNGGTDGGTAMMDGAVTTDDGSVPATDAPAPDAMPAHAGADDGGAGTPAGTSGDSTGGCGCAAPGVTDHTGAVALGLAMAVASLPRRRRRDASGSSALRS